MLGVSFVFEEGFILARAVNESADALGKLTNQAQILLPLTMRHFGSAAGNSGDQ